MLIIVGIGLGIAGIATTILFFAFRAFAHADGGKTRHVKLMVSLIGFVFLCCAVLFIVSFR